MKDKYYTPEIEEFHVGFEYEQVLEPYEIDKPETKNWTKVKYSGNINSIGGSVAFFQGYDIRVKYLDREDIESFFGLKQDYNHNDVRFGYTNGSTRIEYRPYKNKIQIYQWGHEEDTVSGITIKNKSELKKLLKMLEI